jgi:ribosomal protein S15P/S13E
MFRRTKQTGLGKNPSRLAELMAKVISIRRHSKEARKDEQRNKSRIDLWGRRVQLFF